MKIVYSVITVSGKGQVAIPKELRRDLDIKTGDKLIVLRRRDNSGFTFLKLEKMDDLMFKLQEKDNLLQFLKKGGIK